MKRKWSLSLILVIAVAGTICSAGIEYNRTIYDGEIPHSGHSWAGYAKHCELNNFTLRFNLKNLTGGVQANINLNGSNRYAIGFVNLGNGSLATYLFKQEKGKEKLFPGSVTIYDPSSTYLVEISSVNGEILVSMGEAQNGGMTRAIDYFDPKPLPSGLIDFETLENSSAKLRNVAVDCGVPVKKEQPSMGVGYFKPPD